MSESGDTGSSGSRRYSSESFDSTGSSGTGTTGSSGKSTPDTAPPGEKAQPEKTAAPDDDTRIARLIEKDSDDEADKAEFFKSLEKEGKSPDFLAIAQADKESDDAEVLREVDRLVESQQEQQKPPDNNLADSKIDKETKAEPESKQHADKEDKKEGATPAASTTAHAQQEAEVPKANKLLEGDTLATQTRRNSGILTPGTATTKATTSHTKEPVCDILPKLRTSKIQRQTVTSEEWTAILHELETQEHLIQGYQKENEKLISENRELKHKQKDIAEAVREEIVTQQQKLQMQHSPPSNSVVERQQQTNRDLELRYEMLQKEHQTREEEMGLEIQLLKTSKKELEGKLAGVDWQRLHEDDIEIRQLKNKIKKMQIEHNEKIKILEGKVDWSERDVELLKNQDETLRRQAAEIDALHKRIIEFEVEGKVLGTTPRPSSGSGTAPTRPSGKSGSQVKQLMSRIQELEKQLKTQKKVPIGPHDQPRTDSIADLIRASKPTIEEQAKYTELEEKVEFLRKELSAQSNSMEVSLRVCRLESDKMKANYEKKIQQMEEDFKLQQKATIARKTKELQKQVDETRMVHRSKTKSLEQECARLKRDLIKAEREKARIAGVPIRRGNPPTASPKAGGNGNTSGSPRSQHQEQEIEPHVNSHSNDNDTTSSTHPEPVNTVTIANDSNNNEHPPPYVNIKSNTPVTIPAHHGVQPDNEDKQIEELQRQVVRLQEENRYLCDQHKRYESQQHVQPAVVYPQHPSLSPSTTVVSLQRQLQEAISNCECQTELLNTTQNELRRLRSSSNQRIHQVEQECELKLEKLQIQHSKELHTQQQSWLDKMRRQTITQQQHPTPLDPEGRMNFLQAAIERLEALEHRCVVKEEDYEHRLQEIRRVAQFELKLEREKMHLAVKQKHQEIETYRIKLKQYFSELELLRASVPGTG